MEPESEHLRRPLVEPSRPSNSEVGHEIESVLSNQEMPCLKRLYRALLIELNLLSRLAAPAVFVYLINNAMTLSVRIFAGHLGSLELAAVSLANSGFNLFTFGLLLGMGSAVETLCGQAYGAGRFEMLGIYLQRATVVLCITGIPMAILYILSQPILILLGEPSHLASLAATFVYGLIPQIFAYAFNFPIQKFLQSQSIVLPTAYISAVVLIIQIFLTWIAVFRLGFGLIGMSLVHSGAWWILVGTQMVYIKMSPRCRMTWTGLSFGGAFDGLWGFFKLSAASAVMLCLETWYAQILVLLAGLLPNPELSLDSLAICMSIQCVSLMVSVGFNAAASVRISNELGAGNPKTAGFATVVVTVVASLIAVVQAIGVLWYRHVISYTFTGSEAVAEAVSDLSPYLAITIVLNGIQPILSGVAVGCGWQTFVAYVNVGCYYIIGIPAGFLLGFVYNQGAKGIWTGMIGGTLMQTLILLYVTYRTNWNAEVEKAIRRLDKMENRKQPLLKK